MFLLKGFGESWDVGQRSQKDSEQVGAIMEAQLAALVSLMGETNTLGFSNCWVTSCFLPGRVQRGRGLPGQPSLFIAHISCEHRGVQRRKGPVV